MPSAGRSLPTTRPKSWRLQRPHDKGDIAKCDQEKYQQKLLKAVQNFAIGDNQPNLDIIAISFEHKCFSEARNRTEYIAAINAKLREWNYSDISDDEQISPQLPIGGPPIKKQKTSPSPSLPPMTGTALKSGTTSSSSPSQRSSSPLVPMETTRSLTMNLPTPPQEGRVVGRGDFLNLFDPKVLDKVDLNDSAKREEWVTAVWAYFNSGGRWDGGGKWDAARRERERVGVREKEKGDENMGEEWDRGGGWT